MNQTLWLLLRAMLAIALMVGFYVLAFAVIGVLLWIPYAEVAYLHFVSIKLSLACLAGAVAIFVAILPRRDVFEAPGPVVTEQDEPRLFGFIRQVAGDMRQKMPADVYIVNDANAWVTHRGGVMGFGSRRVMGLGLPLMQALPASELRAVLAHEFGHFAGSDVILGPWIHKTYGAIRRTMLDVGHFVVFKWYGTLFLRVTHAISRRQELVADQLAARVAGATVLARALRRTSTLGPAYQAYFQNDVAPVVRAGFLPPVVQGFDQFLRGVLTRQMTNDVRKLVEGQTSADAFDSHPTLIERVTALGCADDEAPSADIGEPASSLLDDAESYTTRLLQRAIGEERLQSLRPIAWNDVGQSIYVERWRSNAVACAAILAPLTFETLPASKKDIDALAHAWKVKAPLEVRIAFVTVGMQCALATRLISDGWQPDVRPGETLALVKGDERCHPFALLNQFFEGKMPRGQWLEHCSALNVSGPLVDAAAAALAAADPVEEAPPPQQSRSTRRRRGW